MARMSVEEKRRLAVDLVIAVYAKSGAGELQMLEKHFPEIVATIERMRETAVELHKR